MTIDQYIQDKKNDVSSYLQIYVKQKVLPEISPVGKWGNDAVIRLLDLSVRGKMIRSSLVFLGFELLSQSHNDDAVIKTASAMELFQSGLLIHDDIMDQDEKRRGLDSVHTQYQKIAAQEGISAFKKMGESFALCVADTAFFLAYQILSDIRPHELAIKLISLFSIELAKVTGAQIQDIYGGNTKRQLTKDEILTVYTYKTGRYSCGLPLVAGAIIAGANDQTVKRIWNLGTSLGILYQIQDDELNLFGNPEITGKPIGSDIREGKQTLIRYFLLDKAQGETKKHLIELFGKPNLTSGEVNFVKKHIIDLKIDRDIRGIVEKQNEKIDEILKHVPINDDKRKLVRELVRYLTLRDK